MTAMALSTSACVVTYTDVPYSPEQLQRRVVDAQTGEGIADAMVVFLWDRNETDIGHASRTTCYRVEMTRTDSKGRYVLLSWNGRMPMIASIFKKGHDQAADAIATASGIDKLKRGSEDFSQRRNELTRSLVQCTDEEDRKLLGLYEEIYEDARSAARTPQEKRTVEKYFLSPLDTARFGPEEARRRAHQREIQQ
jgi:hypothetical protein